LSGPHSPRDERGELGREGEALAARALAREGYIIVARRVRSRLGEIDIVAREGDEWVFVEVKARRSGRRGTPAESVTVRKQRKLARLAQAYLARRGKSDEPARFDVASVELEAGRAPRVEILRRAFDAF
jgi:putative endonuclease